MCAKSILCLAVASASASDGNLIEQYDGALTSLATNPQFQRLLTPQDDSRTVNDGNFDKRSFTCVEGDMRISRGGLSEDATIVAMIAFFCFFILRILEPDPWTPEDVSEILEKTIQIRSEHSIEERSEA